MILKNSKLRFNENTHYFRGLSLKLHVYQNETYSNNKKRKKRP